MQNFGDTLGQVLLAIWASKLRSFLTMFGIAWGVGSLLLLVGLGEGFRSGSQKNLANVGNNVIMMWGGNIAPVANQHTGMRPYRLTYRDDLEIKASPAVLDATAILNSGDLKQVSEFATTSGNVMGVEPDFRGIRFVPIKTGRFIDDADMRDRSHVAVLGKKTGELLFPGQRSALGEWITLNGARFQVVGLVDNVARGNNEFENQKVYIPLTTMQQMFAMTGENIPRDAVNSIQYQPRTRGENAEAKAAAHKIVAKNHQFDPSDPDSFEEWDTIKSEQMVGKIFDAMDVFLGGVGIVTLALGAVGIINIMLVSVTERTREIGLRKALGATNRSILMQFFLEGLLLTGVSGLIGVGGAAGLMFVLNYFLAGKMPGFDPPQLVPWSVFLAMGCLCLSGIVAGIYPARQAAMLEPVEALRRE
jgi:putative ABC transport system permease protein